MTPNKLKPYSPPVVITVTSNGTSVLLACTGRYDCVLECGFVACAPTPAECTC